MLRYSGYWFAGKGEGSAVAIAREESEEETKRMRFSLLLRRRSGVKIAVVTAAPKRLVLYRLAYWARRVAAWGAWEMPALLTSCAK